MDWYFHIKRAPRVTPYLGILGQFKIARIDSYYPYTGQTIVDDVQVEGLQYEEVDIYRTNRAGNAMGFVVGVNFGVDFSVTENLILGINVAPVAYQYNHNISVFKYPQLKFGFRF